MTAPVFLVAPGTLDLAPGAEYLLTGPEARHAVQVRRIEVGERVDLADGVGTRVEGVVRRIHAHAAGGPDLVLEVLRRLAEPVPEVRLVLAEVLLIAAAGSNRAGPEVQPTIVRLAIQKIDVLLADEEGPIINRVHSIRRIVVDDSHDRGGEDTQDCGRCGIA